MSRGVAREGEMMAVMEITSWFLTHPASLYEREGQRDDGTLPVGTGRCPVLPYYII